MVGGRTRKQSARALEAQEHAAIEYGEESASVAMAPQTARQRSRTAAKGKATAVDEVEQDEDSVMQLDDGAGSDDGNEAEPDLTLYCICLGFDTGEQRMIQCEHCSNWFHFGCIGLDNETADRIEAYVCDICSGMGQGSTRTVDNAPLAAFDVSQLPTTEDASSPEFDEDADDGQASADDQEWTFETRNDDITRRRARGKGPRTSKGGNDAQEDVESLGTRRSSSSFYARGPGAKRERSQSFLDDDDDDEVPKVNRSKSRRSRKSAASPPAAPVDPANAPSAPPTEKTRAHCIKQLAALFNSVFSASDSDSGSIGVEARATAFAEEVEAELFEGFFELDSKGVRSPKTKYVTKFRSLHYNLKTNAAFRSRISANELSPPQIVAMSNEDLMRPELRAMADSVRAASLKQSVKEVLAAPTAKRTHKGEEEIDTLANSVLAEEARSHKEQTHLDSPARERSDSITGAGSPLQSPPPIFAGSPPQRSFSPAESAPSSLATPEPSSDRQKRVSLTPTSAHAVNNKLTSAEEAVHATSGAAAPLEEEMRPPPPPKSRSSFDMSSIFGRIKSTSESAEPESTTPKDTPPATESKADDQDDAEFLGGAGQRDSQEDDDFEDILLRGEVTKKIAVPHVTPRNQPQIWQGDLIVPDEGGFPALGVQLGGRPLGEARDAWKRLLPPTFTMDGRIPTATAVKYLVECSVAPTRELVVVGVLPDLSGPTEQSPYKPHKESCLIKHQHIVDLYIKRDRVGVIAPKGDLRKVVKDIYFLPLRKGDSFPEYIDLLDEHQIPPSRSREDDMLLAVLVLQKGILPTVRNKVPASTFDTANFSGAPSSAAVAKTSGADSPIPGFGALPSRLGAPSTFLSSDVSVSSSQPPTRSSAPTSVVPPSNPLQNIDTSALQSLLANPGLLQSALAQSQAPSASYDSTYAPSYGQMPGPYGSGSGQHPPQMYSSVPSPWNVDPMPPQGPHRPAAGPGGHSPYSTNGYTPSQQSPGGGMSPMSQSTESGTGSGQGRGAAYVHPSRAALLAGGGPDASSSGSGRGGPGAPRYRTSSYDSGRGGRGGRGGPRSFGPPGSAWRGRGRG